MLQLVASKHLQEEGELEALINSEWAQIGRSCDANSLQYTLYTATVLDLCADLALALASFPRAWEPSLNERMREQLIIIIVHKNIYQPKMIA